MTIYHRKVLVPLDGLGEVEELEELPGLPNPFEIERGSIYVERVVREGENFVSRFDRVERCGPLDPFRDGAGCANNAE